MKKRRNNSFINNQNNQVKMPIGVKLAIIIGIIILISIGTITIINSYFYSNYESSSAENTNLSTNARAATTVEDKLSTIRSNTLQLLDLLNVVSGGRTSSLSKQAEAFFFERNQEIAAIQILSAKNSTKFKGSNIKIINNRFFISNEIELDVIENVISRNETIIERSCNGETIATNDSPFFGIPTMSLYMPYKENGFDQTCIITFSIEAITEILGSDSIHTTYMINDSDELLSHPENDRILRGESLKRDALVKLMRANNQNNSSSYQIRYEVEDNKGKKHEYCGAYKKISFGDIVVLTTVPMEIILEGATRTRTNNLYLMGIVFFLSIIFILIYARLGISNPLRKLTAAADDIKNGNFETPVFNELNTKRKDEIGVLNQRTKDEINALNTFAKFTNKGVAKAIARQEIDFEPHLKDIAIFFSDIRGFTSISDDFKNKFGNDSPKEIISFLNDYMSRMVNCITLSKGNVDKFEGDAIMAVWGIMRNDNLSFENLPDSDERKKDFVEKHKNHFLEDACNAIRGTIAMRYALMKYNKDAKAFTKAHENEERPQYKPHIQIGCGINVGRATCGIMGSEDKMEYTAIGDAVNFASRTESSNKPCGTDILITEDAYNLLKEKYIRNESNNFTIKPENLENEIVVEMIPVGFDVKGKGIQHFYGVVNMPNFDIEKFFKAGDKDFVLEEDCAKALGPTGPKTLNDVRTLLGIPIPDFEKVNLNEEENKIQVQK